MSEFNYVDYIVAVAQAKRDHPSWRWGQTYMNVLRDWPDIYEEARTSEANPFYDDLRLPEFHLWLQRKLIWKDTNDDNDS